MNPIDPFVRRTRIAYFSMGIALKPELHTYAGGLAVLAGDTARSATYLKLPMVFVTLVSRAGYVRREIDAEGRQLDFFHGKMDQAGDPLLKSFDTASMDRRACLNRRSQSRCIKSI
jgi:glucan phosphorylase